MDAQIKKGVLELCVLYIIREEAMYGYDVMKRMRLYFPEVNESTFYAILRRLNADGQAQITLGAESNGPTRKYYQITDAGRDALREGIESWKRVRDAVKNIGLENEKP